LKVSCLLKGLKPISLVAELEGYYVSDATYENQPSDQRCMRGTRVKVLEEAKHLIITREGSHVVWMSGHAGTGKTCIALSLCDMLKDEPTVLLGGTFFFSSVRSSIKRTAARYVIPTLATLLARAEPRCKMALVAELKRDPDFIIKTVKHQIDNILIKPLNSLEPFDRQIVFVLDGLDQCKDEKPLKELLMSLADFKCLVPVKFLITSRQDSRIRKVRMQRPILQPRIELYNTDLALVTADIQLYVQSKFENSPAAPGWYSDRDPADLAEKADGMFGFAAVAVKYICNPIDSHLQAKRIRAVKEVKAKGLTAVNEMYSVMLTQAMDVGVSSAKRERAQTILSAILASRTPQQVKTLAELLDLPPLSIRESLVDLQVVVFVPEMNDEGELHLLETSFVDFLSKSTPENVRVSESYGHEVLARGCLRRLAADDLCFNISRIQSSYDANPATEMDIPRSLRYACIAWPHHAYNASEPSVYDDQIDSVLRRKFLFWLEVTSRIANADHSPEKLLRVAASKVRLCLSRITTKTDFGTGKVSSRR